jgi:hypothetical protein
MARGRSSPPPSTGSSSTRSPATATSPPGFSPRRSARSARTKVPPHTSALRVFVIGGGISAESFAIVVDLWCLLFCCLVVEYQRRLDLIHDLRFETATTKIKLTPDDQYVIASGVFSLMAVVSLTYS